MTEGPDRARAIRTAYSGSPAAYTRPMPSIEQLEKLLRVDPGDAFVLYGLAMEHAKIAQIDRALDYFERCIAADPSYCYAYFHKARVQSEAGRASDAIETLNRGIAAAKAAGDAHAMAEIRALLDQLT